jgi:histidinol-phosphate phosphatase family protein
LIDPGEIELLPSVVDGLRLLTENNFKFIVVTNQSPVGRKLITLSKLNEINDYLLQTLQIHDIKIEKIFSCIHTPEDGCSCRKPEIGLILDAQAEFSLDKKLTSLIGDSDSDIQAGKKWGCKTIRLNASNLDLVQSDYDAVNLVDAAMYLLKGLKSS